MAKAKYNRDVKSVLDSIFLQFPDVVEGKMFGYPAYYINKKMIACVYENAVGLKVPENMAKMLIDNTSITHFQPLGRRKMREWIQINRSDPNDYLLDQSIFEASVTYLRSLTKKGPSK